MSGVVAVSLVLLAAVALVASTLVGVAARPLLGYLRALHPARRVQVLTTLLALPLIAGLGVLLLSFGPCLRTFVQGLPDDCDRHGGPHFLFCLVHPASASWAAWTFALLLLARACAGMVKAFRAGRATRRVARAFGAVALGAVDGCTIVPGFSSFTAGWPRSRVFLGRELLARLSDNQATAVVAHERAHLQVHHLTIEVLERLLSCFHLPAVGRRLRSELHTSVEQACDDVAATAVGDPLIVAESVIAAARLGASCPIGAIAGFVDGVDSSDVLSRRVEALCNPSWRSGRAALWWLLLATVAATTGALALDQHLHDATEALVQFLGT
jgi:Zn-dependent protease with chaperone function